MHIENAPIFNKLAQQTQKTKPTLLTNLLLAQIATAGLL